MVCGVRLTRRPPEQAIDYDDRPPSAAPDRLAQLAEVLEIKPSRIDRLTKGAASEGLPELRTYFRAKYDLSPEQVEQIVKYMDRYVGGDRRAA